MTAGPPVGITFRGRGYVHRPWEDRRQEFTPAGQDDRSGWRDMVTVDAHPAVRDDAGVANLANTVLGNYQRVRAVVLATDRPVDRPGEYFACVVYRAATFVEVAFSRFTLVRGEGRVVTYAHRIHGGDDDAVRVWLDGNASAVHEALMAWPVPW